MTEPLPVIWTVLHAGHCHHCEHPLSARSKPAFLAIAEEHYQAVHVVPQQPHTPFNPPTAPQ